MKKRILSVLCVLALCLGFLAVPLSVSAASNPCFMAVNDNLLDLEDRYIPITVSGQYYVPYTALDSRETGISLGIFPIYNSIENTLTIYNLDQVLLFDLTAGTCTDRSGNRVDARAITRNGRIYVPARFTSEYFGLFYSSRVTTYGPLVRIRSSSAIITDDNDFVGLAQLQMEPRLREWRKSQTSGEPSTVTPTPAPTPTPVPTSPPEGNDTDKSDVRTYLAFQTEQTDGLAELLNQLEQCQVKALFFFPAAELADYDDAVRSVLCGGHAVGFLVSGTSAEEISDQTREGNRLLTQIAHLNTYTVLAPDVETSAQREELSVAGLLCWNTGLDALPDGRSASRQASTVLANAELYSDEIFILSDTSAAGATLMGRVLPELVQDRYDLRLAVETELQK